MPRYSEEQLEALRSRTPQYLSEVCGVPSQCLGSSKRLFRCVNPEHEDSDPSMIYNADTQTVHCYGCTDKKGRNTWNVFQVAGMVIGLPGDEHFPEQVQAVADAVHYDVGQPEGGSAPIRKLPRRQEEPEPDRLHSDISDKVEAAFYRLFEPEGAGALRYLRDVRGLDDEDLGRHCFGWVAHPSELMDGFRSAPHIASGYLVQPFPSYPDGRLESAESVEYRYATVRPLEDIGEGRKELKPKGYTSVLWREYLLRVPRTLYVCEGIITAASFQRVLKNPRHRKCNVLALNGTSNAGRMLNVLGRVPEGQRPTKIFHALDNDAAGSKAARQIEEGCARLGVDCAPAPHVPLDLNDANDWLQEAPKD